MANHEQYKHDYIAWQNRATSFYLSARLLYQKKLFAPAAYSSLITIELLLKATLVFHSGGTFDPFSGGHGIAKMARMVKIKPNKISWLSHHIFIMSKGI